ncbi:MAG: hypothetical protein ACJA02_000357 [Myxococcota bacterium]|jgi:hypothetical protein
MHPEIKNFELYHFIQKLTQNDSIKIKELGVIFLEKSIKIDEVSKEMLNEYIKVLNCDIIPQDLQLDYSQNMPKILKLYQIAKSFKGGPISYFSQLGKVVVEKLETMNLDESERLSHLIKVSYSTPETPRTSLLSANPSTINQITQPVFEGNPRVPEGRNQ